VESGKRRKIILIEVCLIVCFFVYYMWEDDLPIRNAIVVADLD
jgi:hypothetical protein